MSCAAADSALLAQLGQIGSARYRAEHGHLRVPQAFVQGGHTDSSRKSLRTALS